MGVSIGLPLDYAWNGGSDLQAGVEMNYWEHPVFWLISSSQNDPLLGLQFQPTVWSIGGPISLCPQGEPGPDSKLYTQIKVLCPASCPVSHWPCYGQACHAWE